MAGGFIIVMNYSRYIAFPSLYFAAIVLFCLPAQCLAQQTRPSDSLVNLPENVVLLPVSVRTKKGKYVAGLRRQNFTLIDEKAPQEISFFSNDNSPMSIGIVFDASGSTRGSDSEKKYRATKLPLLLGQLKQFLQDSNPGNEYFLIGFNSSPQLLSDWTSDSNSLLEPLTKVLPKDNSAFFDAAYLALTKVTQGKYRKRALLMLTDGEDNISHYSFKELAKGIQETDVSIYAVGPESRADSLSVASQAMLEELCNLSGGAAFFPTNKEKNLTPLFASIALGLRDQYLLGFVPKHPADHSKWHKLKVKLSLPPDAPKDANDWEVRARQGYYGAKLP